MKLVSPTDPGFLVDFFWPGPHLGGCLKPTKPRIVQKKQLGLVGMIEARVF